AVLSLNRNAPDRDRLDLLDRHAGPLAPRLNLDARRLAVHRERVEPFSHERHSRPAAVAGPRVLSESLRRQPSQRLSGAQHIGSEFFSANEHAVVLVRVAAVRVHQAAQEFLALLSAGLHELIGDMLVVKALKGTETPCDICAHASAVT